MDAWVPIVRSRDFIVSVYKKADQSMKTSTKIRWGQKLPIQKHNAATHFKHNLWVCMVWCALQRGCFNAPEYIIIRHLTWFQSAAIARVGGKALSFHVGTDNLPIYLPLTSCMHLTNTFIFNCQTNIALMDIVCWFLFCIIVFWTWEGCKSSHSIKIRQCIQDLSNETFL